MAIYPLHTTTIINKDVLINSPFKAGMALILDTNGRAIKADSQQLVFNNTFQKYGRFLGFAASDHDLSGNTIIVPDNVGNNHLDINNRFIKNENTEYAAPKRGLMDLQDTAVSNFYNASDPNIISRRGIGVFNTPGDYFVTDQFNPVLHGDYGVDGVGIETINPGDLLTFGGGINAGKLVKVNVNSFGPDVIVVGQVSRYNPTTGLLYFRQFSYNLSFGTASSTVFALDAASTVSYPGSGAVWYDLSGNARNFNLVNGPVYSSVNSGVISFDGTNDYAELSYTSSQNISTLLFWFNSRSFSTAPSYECLTAWDSSSPGGFDVRKSLGSNLIEYSDYYNGFNTTRSIGAISDNSWYFVAITYDNVSLKIYLNNSKVVDLTITGPKITGSPTLQIAGNPFRANRQLNCYFSEYRFLSKALTDTELSSYYNSTKGRYGL